MENLDPRAAHRRLALLRALKAGPGYKAELGLLCELLQADGHGAGLSVVKGDLAWLEAQGLIGTADFAGRTVALLRNDGVDVACGVAFVPGVARPRPE